VFGIGKVLAFLLAMGFAVIPPFVYFFLRPASG
jgi:hypothetical protein